jgi:hypothetical protein
LKGYGTSTFGELNSDGYDEEHDPGTTDEAVALLWSLTAGCKTLELAIGTGRLALPLKQLGLDISGVDGSQDMLNKLQQKPGGSDIPVVVGDMAQVQCFMNAANKLNQGGKFLIEAVVPDLDDFKVGQRTRTRALDMDSALIEAATHDPVSQTVEFQRIRLTQGGVSLRPFPMRYAYPAEIDLMAQLAGLNRIDRWGGWHRESFTARSAMHVSLYQKV